MDEHEFELQLKADFLNEAEEIIQNLELKLLSLETCDNQKECLNELFRNAHTLKGSGMVAGFSFFAAFAHKMENLLDILRSSEGRADKEDVDILLRSLDKLKEINEVLNVDYEGKVPVEEMETLILGRINTLKSAEENHPPANRNSEIGREELKSIKKETHMNLSEKANFLSNTQAHVDEKIPPTVYVCNHDRNVCALIKLALPKGWNVQLFTKCQDLISSCETTAPALAIWGFDMNFLDELADKNTDLATNLENIKLLVFGEETLESSVKQVLGNACKFYLRKPLGKVALLDFVQKTLALRVS